MKRIMVFSIIVFALLTSCVRSYDSIKSEEYSKYCKIISSYDDNSAYLGSPLSYNIIKGSNPFSGYTIKMITIGTPREMYRMIGDPTEMLNVMYPDADLIMRYQKYYYICYKNKN